MRRVIDCKICPLYLLDPFENSDLMSLTAANTEIIRSFPHDLSYEIPALSFAAGGTKIPSFDEGENAVNMNESMQSGWPEERVPAEGRDWLHSDFKDISYRYVYKLFDHFVQHGGLQ